MGVLVQVLLFVCLCRCIGDEYVFYMISGMEMFEFCLCG